MTKYGLHGAFKAKEGKSDNLVQILQKAADMMAKAKGCHLYLVSKDTVNNDLVWVTEVWDSKEDHDQSLHMEGVRDLIALALPLLDGNPEKGQELIIQGGHGI